jgi:hypothetical protein
LIAATAGIVDAGRLRFCGCDKHYHASASVVDLTFASAAHRVLRANVKSKTTLEYDIC